MRFLLACIAATLLVSACGGSAAIKATPSPTPATAVIVKTVIVTVTVTPEPTPPPTPTPAPVVHEVTGYVSAPMCGGGYAITFAAVTVRNEKGEIIGAGTTGDGTTGPGPCRSYFTVKAVPAATFYQIRIGTHDGPSFTFEQMSTQNWRVELTLK